jgi:CheY-like chemotaxis protein
MSMSLPFGKSARSASTLFRQRFRREARQRTYVMHFAASGTEALDRLAEEIQPAVIAVLSDINMSGMDGLESLAEIKQRFPNLPVMMVTAYGDGDRRRRAHELGAFEFLPKPVDFDQLKAQLRQLPAAMD